MTWPERFLLVLVVGIIVWAQVADGPSYKAGYRAGYRRGLEAKAEHYEFLERRLERERRRSRLPWGQPTGAAWRERMARVDEDARVKADEMEAVARKAYQAGIEHRERMSWADEIVRKRSAKSPNPSVTVVDHECEPGLNFGRCRHCGRTL